MTPIDLPPHNLLDALRADRCRPPVVRERESFIEKAGGSHDVELHRPHHQPHVDPPPLPTLSEPLPPGRGWISQPQPRRSSRVNGSFIFQPTPLRAHARPV